MDLQHREQTVAGRPLGFPTLGLSTVGFPTGGLPAITQAITEDLRIVARLTAVPTILQVICQTTGMGFAAVARVTDDIWIACAVRDDIAFGVSPGVQLDIGTTLCRDVRNAGTPIVIENASTDPIYRNHPTPRTYGIESYISAPIRLSNGEYFGNLCAIDPRPLAIATPHTIEMFRLFADLIARQMDDERRHQLTDTALTDARTTAELREQFIAVLGHDLRSPLGAVTAIGEILQRQQQRVSVADLGRRLLTSTRRMSSLIDDVLDFARGRMGSGLTLQLATEHHLDVLFANVVAELQLAHEHRELTTRLALDCPVYCDQVRLQQLLSNLVRNALVHSADGSPICVSLQRESAHFDLEVANAGPPIPPADLPRIFEPYWRRAGREPASQGLGLGLYICSQIVKAHGGTLEVTSSVADGTRFCARIPLTAKPPRPV